ncbi:MAG: pilus assembly protein PilZ [Treponema sp.]|jgi:hypothetical protein|nr:pilus assembly protein PilZ [Treponema sp.]
MSNAPSSDLTGKKIFFLFPTTAIQEQVIGELIQHEYEVYSSKDPARLGRVLKKYSDAIVFVNIDEGMKEPEWEKWIGGILKAFPEVKIGVFSTNNSEEKSSKYINDLHTVCGYMHMKHDMSKCAVKVLEILNILNVKGRRKFIRATTEAESMATVNMPFESDYINGTVKDISVVGISCTFEKDTELAKNTLFKDVQIRLNTILLKVEAIVFGSRMDGGEKIYVFLFTQRIDPEVRVKIRKYIHQNLQRKMDYQTC